MGVQQHLQPPASGPATAVPISESGWGPGTWILVGFPREFCSQRTPEPLEETPLQERFGVTWQASHLVLVSPPYSAAGTYCT